MDGLALLKEAQAAGLKLSLVAGSLVIRGPRRLDLLAKLLVANKDAVVSALVTTDSLAPCSTSVPSIAVGVTETPVSPANRTGFADSIRSKRHAGKGSRPAVSPTPPVEIIADPIVLCPRCAKCRVLPELRTLTGGFCYPCWDQEARRGS